MFFNFFFNLFIFLVQLVPDRPEEIHTRETKMEKERKKVRER